MPQARTKAPKKVAVSSTSRTFVLDTSVLLADPGALKRFAEHEVVLPVVVITELEGKRHHPELGFFARTALRMLDDLRITHGRLDEPVPVGDDGGTIRVELNHTDPAALPSGFRLGDNDTRILAVARNLADEGHAVTLVSKDLPLRIKASAVGLDAEDYRGDAISDSDAGYSGMAELDVTAAELDELYDDGSIDLPAARELPCHCGLVLLSDRGTALGRVGADKQVRLVRGDREAFGIHGRSAEQRVALEMLLDPEVGIVSLGGRAGTGKSALALCARARGHPRAPPAQEGRGVPAAVRRRRPGARLPSRFGEREDVALGPGGLRHPGRHHLPRRHRRGARPRACSRCCR